MQVSKEKTAQGAYVSIKWLDDNSIVDGYFVKFCSPPLEDEPLDDNVFYYCDNVEDLERLKKPSNCLDFIILNYDLVEAITLEY